MAKLLPILGRVLPVLILAGAIAFGVAAKARKYDAEFPTPPPAVAMPSMVTNVGPTSTISGRVIWKGERPQVPGIQGLLDTPDGMKWTTVPNPAAPVIHESNGIANAVVFLKSAPNTAWTHPPARVEHHEGRIRMVQGDRIGSVGFVPVGAEVELVNKDSKYAMIRARGAEFFTTPFPKPDSPVKRTMAHPGIVEFTSAAGYIGQPATLFVCEHPYYTVTDAEGKFRLENVPAGSFELVAWLPNWNLTGKDRDPEMGKMVRLHYDKPWQSSRTITAPTTADIEWNLP
jgi:hypothetical protein